MEMRERFKRICDATPEQLAAMDAVFAGKEEERRVLLRLFRMGDAARETGLSRCTLWRMIKDGRLRSVEIRRGSHRIPEAELRRLVEGRA